GRAPDGLAQVIHPREGDGDPGDAGRAAAAGALVGESLEYEAGEAGREDLPEIVATSHLTRPEVDAGECVRAAQPPPRRPDRIRALKETYRLGFGERVSAGRQAGESVSAVGAREGRPADRPAKIVRPGEGYRHPGDGRLIPPILGGLIAVI